MKDRNLCETAGAFPIHYLLGGHFKVSNLAVRSHLQFALFEGALGPIDNTSSSYYLKWRAAGYIVRWNASDIYGILEDFTFG